MTIYRFGPFRLDKEQLLLSLDDAPLALGPKVVETLLALVEHPGVILGKGELLDRVWPEGFVEEANLAQNIYVIRKTLRAHWGCNAIETVPRRGYRFTGEVAVEATNPAHIESAIVAPRRRSHIRYAVSAVLALAAALAAAIGVGTANVARSHLVALSAAGMTGSSARLYAMGKFYWNQRTAPGIAKSIRYFEAVVQNDPRDARGYAGLASAYAIAGDNGFGPLKKQAALALAQSFAGKALALDSRSAEAHSVLGLVAIDEMHMVKGEAEFRRAIALNPDYAPAHQWYGISLLMSGKIDGAYAELQKAANLDPESVAATDWLSQAAFISRHYKDAVAYGRQTLDLSPQRYSAYQTIGMAYEALGNYRGAIAMYQTYGRTCKSCHFDAAALLAHADAALRDYTAAEQELHEAQRGMALKKTEPDNVLAALIAMGRKNDALAMLRKARAYEPAAMLAVDPRLDALHGDPRFRQYTQGPG